MTKSFAFTFSAEIPTAFAHESCETVQGSKKGRGANLVEAMQDVESQMREGVTITFETVTNIRTGAIHKF
jgi:hypothetical protein